MRNRTRKMLAELLTAAMAVTFIPGTASASVVGMITAPTEAQTEAQTAAAAALESAIEGISPAEAGAQGVLTILPGTYTVKVQAQAGEVALDAAGLTIEASEDAETATELKDRLYYVPREAITEGSCAADAAAAVTHLVLAAAEDGSTVLKVFAGEQELKPGEVALLLIIKGMENESELSGTAIGETAGEPVAETAAETELVTGEVTGEGAGAGTETEVLTEAATETEPVTGEVTGEGAGAGTETEVLTEAATETEPVTGEVTGEETGSETEAETEELTEAAETAIEGMTETEPVTGEVTGEEAGTETETEVLTEAAETEAFTEAAETATEGMTETEPVTGEVTGTEPVTGEEVGTEPADETEAETEPVTEIITETEADTELETEIETEAEPETEPVTEELTEAETESETELPEEFLTDLFFENDEVTVTVTATAEAQLPMNTVLIAEKLSEDSEAYLEAKAAADEESGADPAAMSYTFYRIKLMSDGEELHPAAGTLTAQIEFKNIEAAEDSEQNIFHVKDTGNGKVAEKVDADEEGNSLSSEDFEI